MIDAQRITFIEKENNWFIRYELSTEEKVSKIELEMLKNNKIPNILNISEIQDDDSTVFLYDVTSKVQLSQRMQMFFSAEQLYKMLQSLCRVWTCVDEYMLERKHFILYPELMCVDQETSEIYVMVLPINADNDMEMELRRILTGMLQGLHYKDEMMPAFYMCLLEYVNNHVQLKAKDFQDFLEQVYRKERGVLQPISQVPTAPEIKIEERKEIMHEEAAKEILQSRFQAQNDEMKVLGAEAVFAENRVALPSSVSDIWNKKKPGGFVVPEVPESKTGKERKQVKEKKGLFHGLGFGKKKEKEVMVESRQKAGFVVPTPVTGMNHSRVSAGNMQNQEQQPIGNVQIPYHHLAGSTGFAGQKMTFYDGSQGQAVNQNGYGSFVSSDKNFGQEMQQNNGGGNSSQPYQAWSLHTENNKNNGNYMQNQPSILEMPSGEIQKTQQVQQSFKGADFPVQEKGIDQDATILIDDGIDQDATVLIDGLAKAVSIPVLRSRETGEIVKITYSGFLVGRQKMRNGKIVKQQGVKQPDLLFTTNSVSHSHAVFTEKDGQWYVTDQASLNGTFVNEERLEPKQERTLQEGDILRFASEEYEYLVIKE